jgi:hypothetical protein
LDAGTCRASDRWDCLKFRRQAELLNNLKPVPAVRTATRIVRAP